MKWNCVIRPRLLASLFPCFGLALTDAAGCGSGLWGKETVFREERKSFETSRLDRISIATRSGRVALEAFQEERIDVQIVRRASAPSRERALALLEQVRVEEKIEKGALSLRVEFPASASSQDAAADWIVRVPARFPVSLETHDGSIEAKGIQGRLDVRAHNGPVRVEGCRDGIRARSFDGNVVVSGNPAWVEIETHNGGVQIALDALRAFDRESRIETHNGEIQFFLPAGFSANLRARSASGGVTVEASGKLETRGPYEAIGTLGVGGARLQIESHRGTIRIGERP